ncbi:hypothetical protein Zmor_024852 [Zophobas morio]|uniref:Uncharacterized protein n=1 Tax=Zophobas morio TaxID=2755281 RepID=A0AA38HSS7_9CUCU|nr:hypothetical protein Zmor_024852 [Zophobas morio]
MDHLNTGLTSCIPYIKVKKRFCRTMVNIATDRTSSSQSMGFKLNAKFRKQVRKGIKKFSLPYLYKLTTNFYFKISVAVKLCTRGGECALAGLAKKVEVIVRFEA